MSEISDTWLKINYWVLSHKSDFKKWWVIVFLAVDIFVIMFVVTNAIIYLITIPREKRLILQMVENQKSYQEYRQANQPQELEISSPELISIAANNYDIIVNVKNLNEKWAVKNIKYKFLVAGQETNLFESYVMPKEEKYLPAFSIDFSGSSTSDVEFKLEGITWQRILDLRKYPEVNFKVENIQYKPVLLNKQNITIALVSASVENSSVYNFWQTNFMVILYAGNRVAGFNRVGLEEFKSFEKRQLEVRMPYAPPNVTKAAVYPEVNLLDSNNFM